MATVFWGFLLRLGQVALEASLTLVIGVLVAAVLRRMVTPAGTRRLFGSGWRGLFRGWLAGMLLPVCSLGVIPVAREMRRAGVPGGTVLAFVLAAPLLNPISFLYGLTLAEPVVILTFAAASLVVSTLAGWLWDRVFAGDTAAEAAEHARAADADPTPPEGLRRVLSVFVTAGRELTGRDLAYYAVGLGGSALLASVIPHGALQHTMHHSDPWAPLQMVALGVPVYSSPLPGMMKIGLMFDHGNSIGAAFVLFCLGIGTSLGTLAWLVHDFGARRIGPWFLAYLVVVVGLSYLGEPLLYDTRKHEEDHTHAFDEYSCPFPSGAGGPAAVADKLADKFGPLEQNAALMLGGLLAAGLVCRRLDRSGRLEAWLTARPAAGPRGASAWDVRVPAPVLGGIALAGLVAFSVVGAYVYYPDRDQCLDDMVAVSANAHLSTKLGHHAEAVRHLEQWDLVVRKLEVGVFLREFEVTAERSAAAAALREALEEVRDVLLAGASKEEAAEVYRARVGPAYKAVKQAYRPDAAR